MTDPVDRSRLEAIHGWIQIAFYAFVMGFAACFTCIFFFAKRALAGRVLESAWVCIGAAALCLGGMGIAWVKSRS